jgi:hypothetical protein
MIRREDAVCMHLMLFYTGPGEYRQWGGAIFDQATEHDGYKSEVTSAMTSSDGNISVASGLVMGSPIPRALT